MRVPSSRAIRPRHARLAHANSSLTSRDPRGTREHAERSIVSSPRSNQEASKYHPGGIATAYAQRSTSAAIAALEASHTCAQRGRVAEISAASIIAKVARDDEMIALDKLHPEYGFAKHKGYPTKLHLEKIIEHGVLDCYRQSFKPVARVLGTFHE